MNILYKKPDFINSEGFEWYFDAYHTDFAKRNEQNFRGLSDVCSFVVKKGDDVNYVLINNKQEVILDCHYGKDWSSDTYKTRITALKINNLYDNI